MKLINVFTPKAVIVMYAVSKEHSTYRNAHYQGDDVYFEFAEVHNNKPGSFTPLSDTAADTFGKALNAFANTSIGGFLPENMIYCGLTQTKPNLMWYTPPQKKKLQYNIHDKLDFKTSQIHVPWLVWHYKNEQLYIFATKEKPTIKTKLYKAPFGNIDETGLVCLGSGTRVTSKEYTSFEHLMGLVEVAFWGTRFTHQSDNVLKNRKNLITVHKSLDGTNKPFPLSLLAGTRQTVKSLIDGKLTQEEEQLFERDIDDDNEDFDEDEEDDS
jgi:PRTRC genetic system protein B